MDLTKEEMATVARFGFDQPERRTKRRYAHELYPHAEEGETRPLEVEVPYLLAQAVGTMAGREWHDLLSERGDSARAASERTVLHIAHSTHALVAVALLEGKSGQEAWDSAHGLMGDEIDEVVWEAAVRYGVDPDLIKPYVIRGEPDTHEHWSPRVGGVRRLIEYRVPGRESECDECTEVIGE